MASSKLIHLWRQRQFLQKWGSCVSSFSSSSIRSFSSTTETTHPILPANTTRPSSFSSTIDYETLIPPPPPPSSLHGIIKTLIHPPPPPSSSHGIIKTLIPPPPPPSSSPVIIKGASFPGGTHFPEIFKLGVAGNYQKMEDLCTQIMAKEESESKAKALLLYELIDSFVVNDEFEAALPIFDIIFTNNNLSVIPTSSCTRSQSVHLNNFIDYIWAHRRMDLALHQFQRMNHPNSSCRPNTHTFEMIIYILIGLNRVGIGSVLLDNPSEKRNLDECLQVFDQLFEHLKHNHNNASDCSQPLGPDFYSFVLPFLVKANEPYKVSQLLRMIRDSQIAEYDLDDSNYCIASFCDLYYDTVRAFCYLWRLDDAAQFVMEHDYGSGQIDVLQAYCDAGRFDEGSDFLEKLVKNGSPFTYIYWKYLIRCICMEDKIDKAVEALKRTIFHWNQQHICDNPTCSCINQTSTCDGLVPKSETCPTFSSKVMSELHEVHSEGKDVAFSLAVYIMLISGTWKEGPKCHANKIRSYRGPCLEQVHGLAYCNVTWLEDPNSSLERTISKGADDINSYGILIRGPRGEGEIVKVFGTIKKMVSSWDQEHISACTNAYPSLSDSEGDGVFHSLAVCTMFTTGVWKEGDKYDVGEIQPNGGKQVPEKNLML